MANLNLAQDVANKRGRKCTQLLKMWPILFPYNKLHECFVTVLLLTSTILVTHKHAICYMTQQMYYIYFPFLVQNIQFKIDILSPYIN